MFCSVAPGTETPLTLKVITPLVCVTGVAATMPVLTRTGPLTAGPPVWM